MSEDRKTAEWNRIIEFYNNLIDNYNWDQKPILKLIEQLKELEFWNKYFPSTSHEALGLSTEFNSEKRFEMPMIYIVYKAKLKAFEIHYQKGQGNTILTKNCGAELSKKDVHEIEKWLSDKNKKRTHNNI